MNRPLQHVLHVTFKLNEKKYDKNSFQWDAYDPLVKCLPGGGVSAEEGGLPGTGCLSRIVSAWAVSGQGMAAQGVSATTTPQDQR